jgi:hypothetical protein
MPQSCSTSQEAENDAETGMQDLEQEQEPHYLDEVWTLYFHEPSDTDWNTSSYLRVADVSSLEDYASVRHALRGYTVHGMLFLMREHIFPCWDDKNNIEGGCLSIKMPKQALEGF